MPPTYLDPEDVIAIATVLDLGDEAFIVGGQASNLWAERYATRAPELADHGPFTSVDIDYYGHRAVAEKLADALGGRVSYPKMDNATPNSAVVEVTVNDKLITIDFIHTVLGIKHGHLRKSELIVPARTPEGTVLIIPVMHPVECLISRVANVLSPGLRRRDPVAIRQVQAAPIVVREFIREALHDGDTREAHACLQRLYRYLRSNQFGRRAHLDVPVDPLEIIRQFADDPRLDARYRAHNVQSMLRDIEDRRLRLS